MCAGNFTNQYVALDGQVLDSINRIFETLCTEKSTEKSVCEISLYIAIIQDLEILIYKTSLIFLLCKINVYLLCRS